jgi:translation initiation factor 1A
MPRNYGKGGKKRRKGKHNMAKRELAFKEDGQEYAQVLKMLGKNTFKNLNILFIYGLVLFWSVGGGRLEAFCFDGVKRKCHIRGKIMKKEWIQTVRLIY